QRDRKSAQAKIVRWPTTYTRYRCTHCGLETIQYRPAGVSYLWTEGCSAGDYYPAHVEEPQPRCGTDRLPDCSATRRIGLELAQSVFKQGRTESGHHHLPMPAVGETKGGAGRNTFGQNITGDQRPD